MEENKALVMVDDINAAGEGSFVMDLTSRKTSFTSLKAESMEEKAALYNAMNNPDARLKDHIGDTINVKDIYCEVVTIVKEDTGEAVECPRIVLLDENNISYACVSLGIYGAVKKLIQVFGMPTWNEPLPVKVRQISKSATKNILTLEIAR